MLISSLSSRLARPSGIAVVILLVLTLTVIIPILRDSSWPTAKSPTLSAICPAQGLVGIAGGSELGGLPDSQLDHELDAMRAMGATWLRVGFSWSRIERTRGDYDWTRSDRVMRHAVARGFKILGIILSTPVWARDARARYSQHALPADPTEFASFSGATAERYGAHVTVWEIWNEPNIVAFAKPRPDVDRYHQMLVRSAAQIRAQMHDRQVTIVTGGLSPAGDDGMNIAPATFVKNLYDAGRQSAWDAIGLHPYTFPALPEDLSTAEWNPFQNLDKIRTIVDNHGDIGKQIWFTEYGAPTQGPRSVTPLVQAKSIMQILNAAAKDIHLGPVFIHSSRDRGLDPDNIEHHFGLLNSNFEPKVAFFSVRLLAVCVGD